MTKDQLRKIVADSLGNPASGSAVGLIDVVTDAVHEAMNPKQEKRVIEPTETR